MTTKLDYKFFYDNAGYSYDPKTETPEQGRANCARILACAELISKSIGMQYSWTIDPGTDSSAFDNDPEPWALWQCLAYDQHGDIVASLHGIDFGRFGHPDSDDYSRVVEAELAAEACL
jgi:hypothetical protein